MTPPDVEDIYPLTPLQQGMLFHAALSPRSGAYVEQVGFTVRGEVDTDALARAWQRVVDRHAVLRTAFVWEELEEPVQVVHRGVPHPMERLDWRGLGDGERAARLDAWLAEDRARGFDLLAAPLSRLAIVRTGEAEWRVAWSFHHLLLDGWSLPRVLGEALDFYEAERAGRGLVLPRPRPFREYVLWLRERDAAAAEAYWRGRLAGVSAPTPLGIDRPAAAGGEPGARFGDHVVRLSPETTAALQGLARRGRVTLNAVVQGAWALLLSRCSGEGDVVFGAVVSGRPAELAGVEEMVGMFINTLPVRVEVPEEAELLPWLGGLHERQVESGRFEHVALADVQGWTGVPRALPLFESIYAFENYPVGGGPADGGGRLRLHEVRVAERTGYPLTVIAAPGEGLALRAMFDLDRVDASAARRMLGWWRTLMEAMAADPERRLRDLPLLSPEEREAALAPGRPTDTAYPRDRAVHALFDEAAERAPDAVALEFPDGTATYAELRRRSEALARRLRRAGVGPDDRVALLGERSAAFVTAMLGVLRAGGAYVPLDPSYPPERLAWMLRDSGARVLLAGDALRGLLPAPGVEVLSLEAPAGGGEEPDGALPAAVRPEHLAYVIYTSGSTGEPKGAAVTHAGIVRLVRDTDYTRFRGDDRVAQVSSMSFDAATWEVWGALLHGAALVGVPRETALDPGALAEEVRRRGITSMFLPTSLYHRVAGARPDAFVPLRYLIVGGEAMDAARSAEVLAAGGPAELVNGYGPTEGATFSTWHRVRGDEPRAAPLPLGRPVANTGAYLLDPRGEPAPVGVPGELYLGGPGLARGYLGRPALTAERFVPDAVSGAPGARLYRTGDRARWSEGGVLEFLGRIDQQVKVRGFRVEPGEVEAALGEHPAVRSAAVTAPVDAAGERTLAAYVVPAEGAAPTAAELREHLRARLPEYMVPSAWTFLEALPLTPNGKLDRRALPAPRGPDDGGSAREAPRSDVEAVIAAIWSEVLETGPVGVHDSFFDLGGHSLRATQVISRVRESLQVEVPLRAIFEEPTVAGLAAAAVAHEASPGHTATVARILRMLEGMSEEEMEAVSEEELQRALWGETKS